MCEVNICIYTWNCATLYMAFTYRNVCVLVWCAEAIAILSVMSAIIAYLLNNHNFQYNGFIFEYFDILATAG